MEIHAPEGHVNSMRDVAIHLAIVTAGILIALGLEQTVEWFHHRELASEAKKTILEEIRFNRDELKKQATLLPKYRASAAEVLQFITDISDQGKSAIQTTHLNFSWARLRETNWSTAQSVGALAYMPYTDVEKYAGVYALQADYLTTQSRTTDLGVAAYSVFAVRNRLEKLSKDELEAERLRLMNMIAGLVVEAQAASSLTRAYDEVLSAGASAKKE